MEKRRPCSDSAHLSCPGPHERGGLSHSFTIRYSLLIIRSPVKAVSIQADQASHKVPEAALVSALGKRSIVLVGMMGAGKSSIGRRLAHRMGVPFVDADAEIEKAAGMSISDIFAVHGEPDFR